MPTLAGSPRRRARTATRLVGAAALGVVAQLAVDMPSGYLGARDEITRVGTGYTAALVTLTAMTLIALARRPRWAGLLAGSMLALNVGVFLPAFVFDPVVAGTVVVWSLVLLASLFHPASEHAGVRRPAGGELEGWLHRWGGALRHLALTSLALSVAVVGYRVSDRFQAQAVCLLLGYGTLLLAWPFLRLLRRSGKRGVLLVLLPAAGSLVAAGSPPAMLGILAIAQAATLALLLAQQQTTLDILRSFVDHPSRLIAASFGATILVGTVLLTFPGAAAQPGAISPLDALFTATSATCVTGLIVLDTPAAFSTFGHVVILGLIQVGGLGIMTLSTFAALMLGGRLGLRGERALTEMLELQTAPTAYRLTRFIVLSTLAVEAVGAAALALSYAGAGLPAGEAMWRGLFHSVSAFCNAGFALQSDSLVQFQEAPIALLLHGSLIVLGGLGFVVLASAGSYLLRRGRRRQPLPVQVRTVLAVSASLLLAGTALYGVCEWDRSLAGLSIADKLVNALFQSVTLRTAGFNSVDFTELRAATTLFMILFMFVGAAPGSTGGGIKITTAAVLVAAIRAAVRPGEPTTLFARQVPEDIVTRSLAIAAISLAVVAAGLFLLLLFEPQPFLDLAFEATSAFGTVGLSLGATANLGPAGKLTIIATMFVGRTGPLTLALLLGTGKPRRTTVRYPETRLMVG
ncbi:MAG TPA: TrkH family potassium uptake protein [Thermoanaerobaculia bacterium]|nr:TrkH family potassium uptake protein [Thermoanaerobaculia bacterium]